MGKLKSYCFTFICLVAMWGIFSSFSYTEEWKALEKIADTNPKTALSKLDQINKHAVADNNYPEQLHCILKRGELESYIADGAMEKCIDSLKQYHEQGTDEASRAMASFLVAKCYWSYFESQRYKISGRTDLADTLPADIKEWTARNFADQIREYALEALRSESIKSVRSVDYDPILNKGTDSRLYRPTLYDLLMGEWMDMRSLDGEHDIYTKEERQDFYRQWMDFHAKDVERDAFVKIQLDEMKERYAEKANRDPYVADLERLLAETNSVPASILIRIDLCEELKRKAEADWSQYPAMPQHLIDICQEGIQTFPKHDKIGELKHIVSEINAPMVSVSVENNKAYSKDPLRLKIRYANLTRLELSIHRIDETPQAIARYLENPRTTKVKSVVVDLEKSNYCVERDTVVEIPALAYGHYLLKIEENKVSNKHDLTSRFSVSDLFYLSTDTRDGSNAMDFVVVDAKSGAPKPQVNVACWSQLTDGWHHQYVYDRKSDEGGFVRVMRDDSKNCRYSNLFFEDGKDIFMEPHRYYYYSKSRLETSDNSGKSCAILLDRSIYRPSQRVQYKVIAYQLAKNNSVVLANEKLKVRVWDANHQLVNEQTLTTNEYGSIASSFVLPANGLSGNYRIEVGSMGSHSFKVEEYKRPTFEVKLERPKESFSFGDTITVKGRADYLMGTPLTQANITYQVVRKPFFLWRSWWWNPVDMVETTVAEGELSIQEDGSFAVPFFAQKEEKDAAIAYYTYEILAKVTDANGETREQSISLSVGDRSLFISSPLKELTLMSDFPSASFEVANLNGEGQSVEVLYEVKRGDETVAQGSALSGKDGKFVIPADTKEWISGKYKVEIKAKDDKNREVTSSFETVLYRVDDKRPPVETILWKENVKSVSLPYNEAYSVRVGSSLKDAHLLLQVEDEHGEVEKRWVDLNDEIKDFTFALKEENGDALHVRFFLVRDGELHAVEMTLSKKAESKNIPLKLSVFRDKMAPGSKETWTLTLPKKMEAEVLASMYDASLDQIMPHHWNFSPIYNRHIYFPNWQRCSWNMPSLYHHAGYGYYDGGWYYDTFKGIPSARRRHHWAVGIKGGISVCEEAVADEMVFSKVASNGAMKRSMKQAAPMADMVDDDVEASAEPQMEESAGTGEIGEMPKVRTNFAETAFFYPQLYADKEGNVQLSFEMPESLTRWNFKAMAHTKDLFFGSLSEQVVTQKDFMISPNLPRFMRRGDQCVLSAKVVNLSNEEQSGSAVVQLLDPLSEQVILEKREKFTVAAGKDGAVAWSMEVPRGWDAVLVRVSAMAKNFSDAEQSLLPILSDRMVVTQSLPLYVRGGQTKEYTFDNLVENKSKTLSNRFLKLEFATNPIWYAVQALPSVATVEHENAISYSSAHFTALMASHIAKSNPKIFKVIELWKQQGKDKETLLSNLEKNQDVKNVLLNESPWVMDAKNETEMKQRLSTLFDLNDLQGKCKTWFDKLQEYRISEGGYTWFKGMYPSMHTTLFVMDNYGRLRKAGIVDDALLQKAQYTFTLNYLDKEIKREFEDLKKFYPKDYKKHAYVGMSELYYFQVRSLFPEVKLASGTQEAYNFYYDLMKRQWKDFSFNGKALAAIALFRGGDKSLAKDIVNSLREFSTTTDEMGMFWQKNENGYLWHNAAISTHTRMMEALEVVDPQHKEQDELRLWLLNQKRTQNWGNTIANVDALNVLLLSGSDWLSNDNQVTVKMGREKIDPENPELGTGYFTHIVSGDKVSPSMGKVELQSAEGGNISWGALYWQFEEEIDKVWKNKTGLHVEKLVMLEQREDGKSVLKTIDEKSTLKVGDKLVVRLTLRSDRDMDYVSLKDQRAGCLEPTQQLSGFRWSEGTGYYQSPKDAAMYYFFDHLAKGTYVFEYPLWVTHAGDYCNGITSVQCLYAPEFSSNTGSVRVKVER